MFLLRRLGGESVSTQRGTNCEDRKWFQTSGQFRRWSPASSRGRVRQIPTPPSSPPLPPPPPQQAAPPAAPAGGGPPGGDADRVRRRPGSPVLAAPAAPSIDRA